MKRCLALLLALSVFAYANVALAYDDGALHWRDIGLVLFNNENFMAGKPEKVRNAIWAIRYASQISIDQFGSSSHKAQLKKLHEIGVPGIPDDITDIALYPEHNDHRIYTHLGWKSNYSKCDTGRNKDWSTVRWPERKALLTDSVEYVFNFNGLPGFIDPYVGVHDKCDAFAQLIYYTHILGDQIAYNCSTYEAGKHEVLPLGGTRGTSIISELLSLLPRLFPEQDYSLLENELTKINSNVVRLLNNPSTLRTEAGFEEYHKCALDVRTALSNYIPDMLREENFFKKVFY